MPKEVTTTSTPPATQLPQAGLPMVSGQRNRSLLRPLIWLPVAAAVLLIVFYIVLAQQIGAWQMWGTAGFFFVFIILMLLANRLLKQGKFQAGGYGIILAFAVAGGGAELMLNGVTSLTAISVPLLIIMIGSLLLPGQWRKTLTAIVLYLAYIWLINYISWVPRYDASDLPIINVASTGAAVVLALVVLWLFVRTYASYALRTKLLIAFLVVSLISVGVVVLYVSRTLSVTLQERTSSELTSVAQLRGTAVGDLLTEEVKLLQTLALDEEIRLEAEASNTSYQGSEADTKAALLKLDQTWRAAVDANNDNDPLIIAKLNNPIAGYLREYRTLYPENAEVFVTDLHGALLGATNRTSDYYQADEDWWQAAYSKGSGAIYYSQPAVDESSGKFSIDIALPIYDKSGSKMVGILRTTVDLSAETAIVADVQFGKTSLLFPNSYLMVGGTLSRDPLPQDVLAQLPADASSTTEMAWEGQPSFVAVAPVRASDPKLGISISQLRWKIIAHRLRAEVLAPVEAQTATVLLVFALIALGATGASFGLSQILVRPITRLTAMAQKVAEGDLTAQAAVETRDEIGTLAVNFNNMTSQLHTLVGSLEERVQARTEQLQASAAVGQAVASVLEPEQLVRKVVNLITERFDFYYAAVFILDEAGRYAVLREGTGEAGQILKERGHQLEVGGQSMVGYVTAQRRARIALDVGEEAVRFANPLLPDTRSEIALPLIVGSRMLGALDVQSTREAAFDEANATVLQSMADQIAIALNNAEQFEQTERQADRQSNLNQLSRRLFSATSIEELYRVLATEVGRIVPHDYLSLTQSTEVALREYQLHASTDPVITEGPVYSPQTTLSGRAFTTRQPAVSRDLAQEANLDDAAQLARLGFQSALSLPLIVGERVLGTLNFASQSPGAFSLEDSAHLEQLAGQVAVALVTQRLVQSQQNSLRDMEALTRQLTGQAWSKHRQRVSGGVEYIQYVRSGIETDLPTQLPEIETAIAQRAPVARSANGSQTSSAPYEATLAVPILLRGEVLGALQVSEANQAREWTEDDTTFMQAVADQVALALDNARLIEETERRAQRERLVADISSRMFEANDLETIVQIAGVELGRALHVKQTLVRVRSDMDELPHDQHHDRQLEQQA